MVTLYKSLKGLPVGDVLSLLFEFLSAGMIARYHKDKKRFELLAGMGAGAAAAILLLVFVYRTW